ncbi:VOC family protein [Jiangella asiatica]|uniref:4a-hydroxytetrahydrobiopterin dehydratase n=1 Tax=Jiangella asiatica TaxID=2530372 RepID=A0A4V2Z3K8_9ACTN|nr:VOC family protein [Jiangella asiatica]TDE13078.1 4a-hydroxytetrahydrobiopterin dehydratase [Jiangella asiatica]
MGDEHDAGRALSRPEASAAVEHLGWRYLLARLHTRVAVHSAEQAARVAALAVAAAGGGSASLSLHLRTDHVLLEVQDPVLADVTMDDVRTVGRITTALLADGHRPDAALGDPVRVAQSIELGIDALDIPSVRPFWKAVLGYADEPGHTGPKDPLIDPRGQGPAVWFQQMDAPRPQRNRIHLDVTVPHDEAEHRMAAALEAGGRLVYDAEAPAFWVLADPEGNEACICTWQGRD